jgi:dodecin
VRGDASRTRHVTLFELKGQEGVSMSVYRVIDVIGTSPRGWDDATKEAMRVASGSLRDLRVGEVVMQDVHVESSGELTYRVKLALSFKYEEGEPPEPYLERS